MATKPDPAQNRLRGGIRRFQREVCLRQRERSAIAAVTPQQPHTLIFTCAGSRIDEKAPEVTTA